MKIFIVLSESHLKVREITVYRFVISFLVPELLRFKHLKNCRKNDPKNVQRSGQKSIKLTKSVTSCDGHLILNNPYLYYVSANTCLNH